MNIAFKTPAKPQTEEFEYTNRGPQPWAIVRTNLIRLEWDGDNLIFTRFYKKDDGSYSSGISHTFDNTPNNRITANNVARQIHWGCCGWAAGGHQIWQLEALVTLFLP